MSGPATDIVNHVRTRQKSAGGRPGYSGRHFAKMANQPVVASTICGAEPTAYDMTPRDAAQTLKCGAAEFQAWLRCSECRRIVSRRSGRGEHDRLGAPLEPDAEDPLPEVKLQRCQACGRVLSSPRGGSFCAGFYCDLPEAP